MTVSTTINKVSYACDGATTTYPYTYPIYEDTDLEVILKEIATGTETTLSLTTHYTVTGAGDAAGGNVETVATYSGDYELHIRRILPLTQAIDYIFGGDFPSETHEEGLDRLTMICQQLEEFLDRCLKLGAASSYSDIVVPDPDGQKYLRWDGSGQLENAELVALGDLTGHENAAMPHETAFDNHNAATDVHQGWYADNTATGGVILATSAETAAGNNASKVVTPEGLKDFLGYETIFLPVGAFLEYGAAANAATISSQTYPGTNKQIDYAEFGYSADWEAIDLRLALGPGWDASTLKLKGIWMPDYDTAISSASGVRLGFQVKHLVDGDGIDTNHSTPPIYVADAAINEATGTEHITDATANVATGATGDINVVDLRITRDNTQDNNATAPIRLTGILAMMRRNQTITEW